jgi:hypothetical protein
MLDGKAGESHPPRDASLSAASAKLRNTRHFRVKLDVGVMEAVQMVPSLLMFEAGDRSMSGRLGFHSRAHLLLAPWAL